MQNRNIKQKKELIALVIVAIRVIVKQNKEKKMNAKKVYQKLSSIDYSLVDERIDQSKLGGIPVKKVKEEFLRFLSLCIAEEKSFGPSQIVDEYWHQTILTTEVYAEIAKKTGKFIHHHPSKKGTEFDERNNGCFNTTINSYRNIFGEPDCTIWKHKTKAGGPADCASCCGKP